MAMPVQVEMKVVEAEVVFDECEIAMPPMEMQMEGAHELEIEGEHQSGEQRELGDVKVEELIPFYSACCVIESCYCKFPDCIGCMANETCLCVQQKCACCKPVTEKSEDGICCICNKNACNVIMPSTCCSGEAQACCLDYRGAFPCNKKTPCLVGCCFIHCFAEWKFVGCKVCAKVGDLVPSIKENYAAKTNP